MEIVDVVGRDTARAPLVEPGPELTAEELQRYSRHLIIPEVGTEGQRRLKNARVLVVGAGGLGSPVLLYLAAAGVGTLGIVDDDAVDASNLQRQVVHGTADVGRPKTASAADTVHGINTLVRVVEHRERLDASNALDIMAGYDLVLDGTDSFATRYLVSDATAILGKPCVWGSILRFDGQVTVFWAGNGPTYRDLHPEPPLPGTVPSCAEGGVFGALCGQIGSAMAAEAIKLLTGTGEPLLGRVLVLDALAMRWREVGLRPDPEAVRPVGLLPDYAEFCGAPAERELPALDAAELARLLVARAAGETEFLLVDVREAGEAAIVSIDGAVLVPRGELLSGETELPRGVPVVLHCKSGARSGEVLGYLLDRGYDICS